MIRLLITLLSIMMSFSGCIGPLKKQPEPEPVLMPVKTESPTISINWDKIEIIYSDKEKVKTILGLPDFVDEENAGYLPAEKTLILCTGSQGEYRAALSKIARDEHQHIVAEKGDTVIFSSKVIPGNEAGIINLQNLFAKKGINIITGKDEFVHVSGHPCQDELTEMYKLIKPKSIIPVHGEFRHLVANANLAKNNGIKNKQRDLINTMVGNSIDSFA